MIKIIKGNKLYYLSYEIINNQNFIIPRFDINFSENKQ